MSNPKCRIMGVDPGQKGAIAYVERDSVGQIIDVRIIDAIVHRGSRDWQLDTQKMLDGMTMWPVANLALMENQILKQGKGVQTMYINFGLLLGVVERCANRTDFVTSREWKAHYGLSKDKSESIELVRELYPDHLAMLMRPGSKQPSSDRAEALLLERYAYMNIWKLEEISERNLLL